LKATKNVVLGPRIRHPCRPQAWPDLTGVVPPRAGQAPGSSGVTAPRRLRLSVVEGFRKPETEKLAKRDLAAGSNVASDGLPCRPAVEKVGRAHFPTAAGAGRRAAGRTPSKWVNATLGNVETALVGPCHHASPKHARHHMTSFACRFDQRFRLDGIVERLARGAVHTVPHPYRVVTADAYGG